MDDIPLALIIAYAKPVLFTVVLALASIGVLALFIANPKWPALALFMVFLNFINPSYGFLEGAPINIYEWKPRILPFALMNFYLYALFLAVLIRNAFSDMHPLRQAGGIWMVLFAIMFAGHIIAGMLDDKAYAWPFLFHGLGLVNVVHMSMLIYIAVSVLGENKNLVFFVRVFLLVALGRAIFGLVRFLFFGGDPQNAYAIQGITLTYWDLNEGLIATIAAFYFSYRLSNEWAKLTTARRLLLIAGLVIEIAIIVLSFRRSNIIGLVLASLYFLSLFPWRKKILYAMVGVAVILPAALSVVTYRAQQILEVRDVSIFEAITQESSDLQLGERGSRFYELQVAYRSLEDNPLLGIGSWNAFRIGPGDLVSLAYHQGNFHFIHSGFGHVLLKSGLLGLVLFVGALFAAWRFAGKARHAIPIEYRAPFESFRAGLWFLIPTLMFGTPIVEMRTMLWLAMVLAVPIAVARLWSPKINCCSAPELLKQNRQ